MKSNILRSTVAAGWFAAVAFPGATKRLLMAFVAVACLLAFSAAGVIDPSSAFAASNGGVVNPVSLTVMFAGAGMLDVFKGDAFSIVQLTDRTNKMPFIPGRAGQIIDWNEEGVFTTVVAIEEVAGTLTLLSPSARGGPGTTVAKDKRKVRNLTVPHFQIDDGVYADEVQGIRAFGEESQVQTVQGVIDGRVQGHVQLRLDPTLEFQRMGALKGIITYADGSSVNLFTEFNVSQPAEVAFDLTNAVNGAVRKTCTDVIRTIATALGGLPFRGVYSFCSDTFWDDLIKNPEVRATYLNQQEASQLRSGVAWSTLNFGGITFENYRGSVGATQFATADKAHFFPVGVPGAWRTLYAPADYIETVNTQGLPRYTKQFPMPNDKGINLEVQMNALNYMTRPNALVQGKRGA